MAAVETDGLVFINYTNARNAQSHDAKTRQAVRKRAWHAWWNKEPKKRLKDRSTQSLKQSQSRFRLRVVPKGELAAAIPVPRSLSPFQAVIESDGDDAWDLLSFYFHRFRQNSAAVNTEGDWIAFAFADDASRYAQLALIALNASFESHPMKDMLATRYASKAMSLVRAQLQDLDKAPSDSLVGAVALLSVVENLQGDRKGAVVHYQGLNNLVSVRGGYDGFSSMKVLQRVIIWAQRSYWLRWHDDFVAMPEMPLSASVKSETEQIIQSKLGTAVIERFEDVLSEEIIDILAQLQYIASLPPPRQRSAADRLLISDTIYDVEYRAMLMHQEELFLGDDPIPITLSFLVRIAIQLYVLIVLRQMHGKSKLAQRFRNSLSAELELYRESYGEFRDYSEPVRCLILWMLNLVLLTTFDETEFARIASYAVSLFDGMGLRTLSDLQESVAEVAWMGTVMYDDMVVLRKKLESLR